MDAKENFIQQHFTKKCWIILQDVLKSKPFKEITPIEPVAEKKYTCRIYTNELVNKPLMLHKEGVIDRPTVRFKTSNGQKVKFVYPVCPFHRCLGCRVIFKDVSDIRSHVHRVQKCKYHCKDCNKQFNFKKSFYTHVYTHSIKFKVDKNGSKQLNVNVCKANSQFEKKSNAMIGIEKVDEQKDPNIKALPTAIEEAAVKSNNKHTNINFKHRVVSLPSVLSNTSIPHNRDHSLKSTVLTKADGNHDVANKNPNDNYCQNVDELEILTNTKIPHLRENRPVSSRSVLAKPVSLASVAPKSVSSGPVPSNLQSPFSDINLGQKHSPSTYYFYDNPPNTVKFSIFNPKSMEEIFSCDMCPRRFSSKQGLENHKILHSDIDLFYVKKIDKKAKLSDTANSLPETVQSTSQQFNVANISIPSKAFPRTSTNTQRNQLSDSDDIQFTPYQVNIANSSMPTKTRPQTSIKKPTNLLSKSTTNPIQKTNYSKIFSNTENVFSENDVKSLTTVIKNHTNDDFYILKLPPTLSNTSMAHVPDHFLKSSLNTVSTIGDGSHAVAEKNRNDNYETMDKLKVLPNVKIPHLTVDGPVSKPAAFRSIAPKPVSSTTVVPKPVSSTSVTPKSVSCSTVASNFQSPYSDIGLGKKQVNITNISMPSNNLPQALTKKLPNLLTNLSQKTNVCKSQKSEPLDFDHIPQNIVSSQIPPDIKFHTVPTSLLLGKDAGVAPSTSQNQLHMLPEKPKRIFPKKYKESTSLQKGVKIKIKAPTGIQGTDTFKVANSGKTVKQILEQNCFTKPTIAMIKDTLEVPINSQVSTRDPNSLLIKKALSLPDKPQDNHGINQTVYVKEQKNNFPNETTRDMIETTFLCDNPNEDYIIFDWNNFDVDTNGSQNQTCYTSDMPLSVSKLKPLSPVEDKIDTIQVQKINVKTSSSSNVLKNIITVNQENPNHKKVVPKKINNSPIRKALNTSRSESNPLMTKSTAIFSDHSRISSLPNCTTLNDSETLKNMLLSQKSYVSGFSKSKSIVQNNNCPLLLPFNKDVNGLNPKFTIVNDNSTCQDVNGLDPKFTIANDNSTCQLSNKYQMLHENTQFITVFDNNVLFPLDTPQANSSKAQTRIQLNKEISRTDNLAHDIQSSAIASTKAFENNDISASNNGEVLSSAKKPIPPTSNKNLEISKSKELLSTKEKMKEPLPTQVISTSSNTFRPRVKPLSKRNEYLDISDYLERLDATYFNDMYPNSKVTLPIITNVCTVREKEDLNDGTSSQLPINNECGQYVAKKVSAKSSNVDKTTIILNPEEEKRKEKQRNAISLQLEILNKMKENFLKEQDAQLSQVSENIHTPNGGLPLTNGDVLVSSRIDHNYKEMSTQKPARNSDNITDKLKTKSQKLKEQEEKNDPKCKKFNSSATDMVLPIISSVFTVTEDADIEI